MHIEVAGTFVPIVVEEVDFLDKPVNAGIVVDSAAVLGITENHKHYGLIVAACQWGGYENYSDLFQHIDVLEEKRSREWASLGMPTVLVDQCQNWKRSIHRSVEGGCHAEADDLGCW